MKKLIPILFLLFIFIVNANTQDVYYTHNASLQINGEFDGKKLTGTTQDLRISLDYETTEIIIRFHLNSLLFNADTLNKLILSNLSEVVFTGKLGLDYIITDNHPPLKFNVKGWLENNATKRQIEGKGELHHIANSENFSCMLGMAIILDLNDYNVKIPNLEDEMEVIITQALLRKDKN